MKTIFAAAAAFICLCGVANADYKSEYKAYVAAFNAGDAKGALDHGEKAWREAETEIGASETTAILAYNYGRLVAGSDPEKAQEAFERARAITKDGKGSLRITDLDLRIATLRHVIAPTNDSRRALRDALAAERAADPAASDATVSALAVLAHETSSRRGPDSGTPVADAYLDEAERLEPRDPNALVDALMLAGILRVSGADRTSRDIAEATEYLDRAISMFSPQKDIDHFDKRLAVALVWRSSLEAVVQSYLGKPHFDPISSNTRIPTDDLKKAYERAKKTYTPPQSIWEIPRPEICDKLDWAERKPPPYPRKAQNKGAVGAALVGYEVDAAQVTRTVLLAELAGADFGKSAINSMSAWKFNSPPSTECFKNNLTSFYFILN